MLGFPVDLKLQHSMHSRPEPTSSGTIFAPGVCSENTVGASTHQLCSLNQTPLQFAMPPDLAWHPENSYLPSQPRGRDQGSSLPPAFLYASQRVLQLLLHYSVSRGRTGISRAGRQQPWHSQQRWLIFTQTVPSLGRGDICRPEGSGQPLIVSVALKEPL